MQLSPVGLFGLRASPFGQGMPILGGYVLPNPEAKLD